MIKKQRLLPNFALCSANYAHSFTCFGLPIVHHSQRYMNRSQTHISVIAKTATKIPINHWTGAENELALMFRIRKVTSLAMLSISALSA